MNRSLLGSLTSEFLRATGTGVVPKSRWSYALGGTTPTNFLKAIGMAFDGNAPVVKEGYETSVPGLYLIGDLSAGKKGGSINLAFNMAARAMRAICVASPEVCETSIKSAPANG